MAWFRRSRPCLAEPPAESPSTRNNSDFAGSLFLTVGELSGESGNVERRLSPGHLAGLASCLPGTSGLHDLLDKQARFLRALQKKLRELLRHARLDDRLHLRRYELVLCL